MLVFFILVSVGFLWLFHRKKPPIVIGFMGPLTGKYSDLGVLGRNGAMLAVEDVNAEGGINGHLLVLIPEDDKGTPEGTKEVFQKLRDAGVVAIVGPMLSTNAVTLKPLIDDARLVAVSPTVSTSRLSGLKDYFFRVMNDNKTRARGLAQFAIETLPEPPNPPRLWCLVYDIGNWEYTSDFIENFVTTVEVQGDLTAYRVAYLSKKELIPEEVFKSIEVVKPDVIVLAVSAIDASQIIGWLADNFPDIPVFAGAWAMTPELISHLPYIFHRNTVNVFAEHVAPPENIREIQSFEDRFNKRYGKKMAFPALYAYNAVRILAKALKENGGKVEKLKETLSSGINCDCISGKIFVDEFGDCYHPWWIYKLEKDGPKFVREVLPQWQK